MQEIFNKVEQNQLQRTKNVGKFLDATETLSISAGSISSRAEMCCGTPPTDPSHPLVNSIRGGLILIFSKGGGGGLYFSKALYEGLIFGGAYIRRGLSMEGNLRFKIDRASLFVGSKFTGFALFYFVFEGNFPLYLEGRFNGGFLALPVWGVYIWRGLYNHGRAYFRNFTVCQRGSG